MDNTSDRLDTYSKMLPLELKILLNEAPNDDLSWALFMYLFRHSGNGNIITLGKMSTFFGLDKDVVFEKLNKMSALWVRQYLNSEGNGKIYYTYEITDISADLMVKLIELLEKLIKNKKVKSVK